MVRENANLWASNGATLIWIFGGSPSELTDSKPHDAWDIAKAFGLSGDYSSDFDNLDLNSDTAPLDGVRDHPEKTIIQLDGMLGDMQEYLYRNSMYPSKNAAGLTALTLLSSVVSAYQSTPTNLKLSLYSLVVMPSGTGKDALKHRSQEILEKAFDLRRILGNMGASKQALHMVLQEQEVLETAITLGVLREDKIKALLNSDDPAEVREGWSEVRSRGESLMSEGRGEPATTFIPADEFHQHFVGLETAKDCYQRQLRDYLMSVYTERGTLRPTEAITTKYLPLHRPSLSILGFSTPAEMYSVLGEQVSNGFVGRLLIYPNRTPPEKCYDLLRGVNAFDLTKLKHWRDYAKRLHGECVDGPGWGEGSLEHYISLDMTEIEPLKVGEAATLAGRLGEKMLKVATLLALSESFRNEPVKPMHLDNAWEIVRGLHEQFVEVVGAHGGLGASRSHRVLAAVEDTLKRWSTVHASSIPHSKLKENCAPFAKAENRLQDEVISQLEKSGLIRSERAGRGLV